jgi:hypothetical protein
MIAPFPYFGGKRTIAADVWARLGRPKQYVEPFCGSCAMLLAAPKPASLEVVGDLNGFIANFWRATVARPAEVARAADYPVSHVDLGARHSWLLAQRGRLAAELQDAEWPGDAKAAGWWLWGQCCWIGSGWCEWDAKGCGDQIPHVGDAGMGIQAIGKIPHVSDAGREGLWTSGGRTAWAWLHKLAARMERVRVIHGAWDRCLNHHYGGDDTAVFLDPPYEAFAALYGAAAEVSDVVTWCRENAALRIALCGHRGDYDFPGWDAVDWERERTTYGSTATKAEECVWYSPGCLPAKRQGSLF